MDPGALCGISNTIVTLNTTPGTRCVLVKQETSSTSESLILVGTPMRYRRGLFLRPVVPNTHKGVNRYEVYTAVRNDDQRVHTRYTDITLFC